MSKPSWTKHVAAHSITIALIFATFPFDAEAKEYNAICSYYSEYNPCKVKINNSTVKANLPTDLLILNKKNFLDMVIYEDLHKSSNIVIGTVSTLLLGPIGLLGFLAQKKSGTIDYAFKFKSDDGRRRTALIRFKNLKVAGKFGEEIISMLPELTRTVTEISQDL